MPYKNIEKQRAYVREWCRRNREQNPEKVRSCAKERYYKNYEKELLRLKKYREENREKIRVSARERYYKNREKELLRHEIYRNNNREKIREYDRKRRLNPYCKEKRRLKQNNYYKNNIHGKLAILLRGRSREAIKENRAMKWGSMRELLGADIETCRKYLESKFQPGMSWANHGYYGWHIDHEIPLDSFDLTKKEEQLRAFHYTNLQPMWWRENLIKHNKIL